MTYEEALKYIHSVNWVGSKLGLERTQELLGKLGDPHKRLKFIHIAGTNGKGSTAAMLASVLEHAGYRVGLYTSPFINRFNERMQVNGRQIPDETLSELTEHIQPYADAMEDAPTEFELITALAMEYFRQENCEIVVLEVGMGGELDSTNVIDVPEAAVIAAMGLDHVKELGPTMADIARAKAGIIKTGGAVVSYGGNPDADEVFAQTCREKGASLRCPDFSKIMPGEFGLDGQRFSYGAWTDLQIPLAGRYQLNNAAVVLETVAVLRERGWNISDAAVRQGIAATRWPARFEVLRRDPVFIVDGGHNPHGIRATAESLVLLKNNGVLPLKPGIRKIAVIGCHAANARSLFGGYTHLSMAEAVHAVANSIAGLESGSVQGKELVTVPGTQIQSDETEEFDEILRHQKPGCPGILEKLREKLGGVEIGYAYGYAIAGNDFSHMEEALRLAEEADVILMTLGGKHGSCSVASTGEGVDAPDIKLPECQEEFIRRAAQLGKPMVGIHLNGRPISSDAADRYLDAILEAWNPSEMGAEAIAQVLTGEYNPGGKLPVSVARNAGQIPIYYNHPNGSAWHQGESIGFAEYVDMPHTPRYFFGHGLSYTEFAYSGLHVAPESADPEGTVEITVEIENMGKVKGDEVVQLYLRDVYASMTRSVKELAGFKRVTLEPGEKRKVVFRLQCSQTAFLDSRMQWKVEKGEFEVQIGSSSEDIRQRGSFRIVGDKIVEGKSRGMYAEAEVR